MYSSWTLHHRTHLFLESCLCNTEKGPGLANGQDGISQLRNWTPASAPGHNSAAHEHQSPQVTKCTFFLKMLKHWPILCWAALPQLQINRGKSIAISVSNEISTEKRTWLKSDFCSVHCSHSSQARLITGKNTKWLKPQIHEDTIMNRDTKLQCFKT